MKVAIVGFGYWGEIILKSLLNLGTPVKDIYVVDIDQKQKEKAQKYHLSFSDNLREVFDKVDVVVIATWEHTHYEIAKKCLLSGKSVLVEKPLTTCLKEAQELFAIARENNLTILVDTTFLFDKTFLFLKEKINRYLIGDLLRVESVRFSANIVKPFTNVIADLLPHDISVFGSLLGSYFPEIISVVRQRLINKNDDNAQITLRYGKTVTNSFLSWTNPLGRREMTFYGQKGALVWTKKDSESDAVLHFSYDKQRKLKLKKEYNISGKSKTLGLVLTNLFKEIKRKKFSGEKADLCIQQISLLEKVLKTK